MHADLRTPLPASLCALAAGELRLILAPEAGGSIASYTRLWREGRRIRELHWLRPATAAGLASRNPLDMASFPLVPFCNRLRHGRATFAGRQIAVAPNHPREDAPHPLHGIGWLRPWQATVHDERTATLRLDVPASAEWPWRFSARQQFALAEDALTVVMEIRNEDTAEMPAGIGHHPYFPHLPGTRVQSRTQAMWRTDAEVMPTTLEGGGPVPLLAEGVKLSRVVLDNNFTGWDRQLRIDWPADAIGPARHLVLDADPPLEYFVLYSPAGLDHFCAEPVSQCTDWLNLLDRYGRAPLGGAVIAPGESLHARFVLRPACSAAA